MVLRTGMTPRPSNPVTSTATSAVKPGMSFGPPASFVPTMTTATAGRRASTSAMTAARVWTLCQAVRRAEAGRG